VIARFRIEMPFVMHCAAEVLQEAPVEVTLHDLTVRLFPPYRSRSRPAHRAWNANLPRDVARTLLEADDDQTPSENPTINGQPTLECNALLLECHKKTFDRNPGSNDPDHQLLVDLANDWLGRLRLLVASPNVRLLPDSPAWWQIRYVNDDGSDLPLEPPLLRRRFAQGVQFESVALNADLWARVAEVPWGYRPDPARTLLVDASACLPDVGTAVVLAFTALETCITRALDTLAPMYGVKPLVWNWINDRGDFLKHPSVRERFDSLLSAISRHSLKEEPELWEAFRNLQQARNKFAHEGTATIGGVPVDQQKAAQLLLQTGKIVDWIEAQLPPAMRTPKFDNDSVQTQATIMLVGPESAPESSQDLLDPSPGEAGNLD